MTEVPLEMPQTPLSGRDAADYADLVSIISDLERVIDLAHALRGRVREDDVVVASALWESAVITYGRCFKGGRPALRGRQHRRKVPVEALDMLGPELTEAHAAVIDLRDHHVGHRIGEGSAVRVAALHEHVGGPPVGVVHFQMQLLLPDNHVDLPKLAHCLLGYLKPLAEAENRTLLLRVQADHSSAG